MAIFQFENSKFLSCQPSIATTKVVAGSAAWLERGLSCICAQRREHDACSSFKPTPLQLQCKPKKKLRLICNAKTSSSFSVISSSGAITKDNPKNGGTLCFL